MALAPGKTLPSLFPNPVACWVLPCTVGAPAPTGSVEGEVANSCCPPPRRREKWHAVFFGRYGFLRSIGQRGGPHAPRISEQAVTAKVKSELQKIWFLPPKAIAYLLTQRPAAQGPNCGPRSQPSNFAFRSPATSNWTSSQQCIPSNQPTPNQSSCVTMPWLNDFYSSHQTKPNWQTIFSRRSSVNKKSFCESG